MKMTGEPMVILRIGRFVLLPDARKCLTKADIRTKTKTAYAMSVVANIPAKAAVAAVLSHARTAQKGQANFSAPKATVKV